MSRPQPWARQSAASLTASAAVVHGLAACYYSYWDYWDHCDYWDYWDYCDYDCHDYRDYWDYWDDCDFAIHIYNKHTQLGKSLFSAICLLI